MLKLTEKQKGYAYIISSGMCFGALGYFGKEAYKRQITPGELLALRYFISAILCGLIILITKPKSIILKPFEWISSLCLGIFGYALFSSFFFIALTGLSASLTVLLLYTYPVMVAVLSRFILKEQLGLGGAIALNIVTIGLVLLVWGEWAVSEPRFILYGLGAAFFYALYIIYSRKYLSKVEAMPSSFYVQLGAGVILSLIHFKSIARPIEIISLNGGMIFSMAIICSLMAMTLFLAGLRRITSSEASILSTTEPVSGVAIAGLFLGERLILIQWIGATLILLGLIQMARTNASKEESPSKIN
jgi:drug/metabolite transporter (DMT)-like permease